MSDPFSVAGSAVGVISLGLFVCGEIVQYAQNVQGQNDDMRYLMTKATNVRLLMRDLRGLIEEKRYDLPEVAADLESKALDLKVYLDRLSAKIQQYGLLPSHIATKSAHSRAKSTIKRAFYPFRKETLFEIRDCLESMEMDLEAALTVFSARELHRLGLKQDIVSLKQDLLIEKMDTLQLSITTTSQQTILQQPTSQSISCSDIFRIQRSRAPLMYNWKNAQAKQTRKQYRFYSRLLRRTFTGTFYLSTGPGFFSILPSLHCHSVVGVDSWLCTMLGQMSGSLHGHGSSGNFSSSFMTNVDGWIQQFQLAVSEGKVRPTDKLMESHSHHFSSSYTLIDFPSYLLSDFRRDVFPGVHKFVTYMLDHGVVTDYQNESSVLRNLCRSYIWVSEEENQLARYIIERCGPINWAPAYWIEKRNMQRLLANGQDDLIDLPPGYIAALQESEDDLRALLESNSASSEDSVDGITLLQITMGWPAGVKLMLRPQSGNQFPDEYHRGTRVRIFDITDQDSKIKEYSDSCNILLEAGYRFSHGQIIENSSKILRSLFISELATRRRKLLDVSRALINPSEMSDLRGEETGLPDISASMIWASLMTNGHRIDQSLRPSEESHLLCLQKDFEILMELYEAGFTDLDQIHPGGYTPLMIHCDAFPYAWSQVTPQGIAWMISKGANPSRELPNSNTTTIHLFNQRLGHYIFFERGDLFELRPLQQIGFPLLSTSPRDSCSCSCSVGGCTPLSVAVREVADPLRPMYTDLEKERSRFQLFLRTIIEYNQSKSEVCHAMIRILTFNGLGLSHTCCTNLKYNRPWETTRDEYDLQEIRDEQKIAVERFEKLVSEFGSQFNALELPLMDFLQGVWYKRMVQFLSERDDCDPEHHEGTRRLGILLETDDIEIPLVVQYICDRVTVVEDDSEGS